MRTLPSLGAGLVLFVEDLAFRAARHLLEATAPRPPASHPRVPMPVVTWHLPPDRHHAMN